MNRPSAVLVDPLLQDLLDRFSRLFGIRIALFDTRWRELQVGVNRSPRCAFCQLLRDDLGQDAACVAEDRRRRLEVAASGTMVSYRCHAGLDEALLPIALDGQLTGWLMVGQFRTSTRPPPRLLDAPWVGNQAARVRQLWREVPYQPASRRDDILTFFRLLAETVVNRGLVQVKRDPVVEDLLNAGPLLSLAEAGRRCGLGRTALAERVRASQGCGLRQAQIAARLERAKRLLLAGATVTAAAQAVGYRDPLYFSRLFRQRMGVPPSQLRPKRPTGR